MLPRIETWPWACWRSRPVTARPLSVPMDSSPGLALPEIAPWMRNTTIKAQTPTARNFWLCLRKNLNIESRLLGLIQARIVSIAKRGGGVAGVGGVAASRLSILIGSHQECILDGKA